MDNRRRRIGLTSPPPCPNQPADWSCSVWRLQRRCPARGVVAHQPRRAGRTILMKFRNGAWLWHDGVTPHVARRLVDYRIDGDSLWLAAVDREGAGGADSFEGTVLEMRVTSPMRDVIRVQISHHRPHDREPASFDLDRSLKAANVRVQDEVESLAFTSGKLTLTIDKGPPWRMRFVDEVGTTITSGEDESLGYMRLANGQPHRLTQRLSLGVGECIYGLGERFGPIVRNGQTVKIWNEDAGTTSDQAYKNIPFYLSSRGYGVLVNTPGEVEFEVATEFVSQLQFSVPQESLDYFVFLGPDPKDVLEKYTRAHRPAGAAATVVVWAVAEHIIHDEVRRENRERVRRWHAVARHSAQGVSLRLLLDARTPLVRLRVGPREVLRPTRDARAAEIQGPECLRLDQPVHLAAFKTVRRRPARGILHQAPRWQRVSARSMAAGHGVRRFYQSAHRRMVSVETARAA